MNKEYYIRLRNKYLPSEMKTVFICESPPASGKYFYDERGRVSEPLFSAMMKLLKINPITKKEGLKQFAKSGCFLVDASYEPVNQLKSGARKKVILQNYENLVNDLKSLGDPCLINFILVKATLFELLEKKLLSEGYNVINNHVKIPFPTHGHQRIFHDKVKALIKN